MTKSIFEIVDEYPEIAWGIEKSGEQHKPLLIARPKVTDFAVKFEMLYCGICHSDVHTGKNDWGPCELLFAFAIFQTWFNSDFYNVSHVS